MEPDFNTILNHYDIGELHDAPQLITSGLTNQLYYIKTTHGQYALKVIQQSSPRVRTKEAYEAIERYANTLFDSGIKTVFALQNNNTARVTTLESMHCFIYTWQKAETCYFPIDTVLPYHAYAAGKLLGKLHIEQNQIPTEFIDSQALTVNYDTKQETLETLITRGLDEGVAWGSLVAENLPFLSDINKSCLAASARLRSHVCFSHGDFMPHNLMWPEADKPTEMQILIDWELGGFINPGIELVLALISHSQFPDEDEFNETTLTYFMQGYFDAGAILTDTITDAIYGALNKGWLNWIVFNMKRSLTANTEKERALAANIVCHVYNSLTSIVKRMSSLVNIIKERADAYHANSDVSSQDAESLTHHQGDFITEENIKAQKASIISRLGQDYHSNISIKDKLLSIVNELSQFELGRFFIKNQGALSGYWTHYVISGFSESNLEPLERTILTQLPSSLATRQRFNIFQDLLHKHIRSHSVVCSVPCGSMMDLISLDLPDEVVEVRFVGIDLDKVSIDLAKSLAKFHDTTYSCQFFQQNAWDIGRHHPNSFDVITTNGLNIYERDDRKVIDLYTALQQSLKPGGKLIGSALSSPADDWSLEKIDPNALELQRAIFSEILQATWANFRTPNQTKTQLKEAGFNQESIEIIWDDAHLMYTFMAEKSCRV